MDLFFYKQNKQFSALKFIKISLIAILISKFSIRVNKNVPKYEYS